MKRPVRESEVEKRLRIQVKRAGGLTRKFVSPGHRGVPDRIVVWPGGEVHFIETKAPLKGPRADQRREHKRLSDMGCIVRVISTLEGVDAYVAHWGNR